MKKILLACAASIAAIVFGATLIHPQTIQLNVYWDLPASYSTWKEIRVYEVTAGSTTIVATAPCAVSPFSCPTSTSLSVTKAAHTYIARSYDGFWESSDSNQLAVAPPSAPANLRR